MLATLSLVAALLEEPAAPPSVRPRVRRTVSADAPLARRVPSTGLWKLCVGAAGRSGSSIASTSSLIGAAWSVISWPSPLDAPSPPSVSMSAPASVSGGTALDAAPESDVAGEMGGVVPLPASDCEEILRLGEPRPVAVEDAGAAGSLLGEPPLRGCRLGRTDASIACCIRSARQRACSTSSGAYVERISSNDVSNSQGAKADAASAASPPSPLAPAPPPLPLPPPSAARVCGGRRRETESLSRNPLQNARLIATSPLAEASR